MYKYQIISETNMNLPGGINFSIQEIEATKYEYEDGLINFYIGNEKIFTINKSYVENIKMLNVDVLIRKLKINEIVNE